MNSNDQTWDKDEADALIERMKLAEDHVFRSEENIARLCSVIANRTSWIMQSMYGERFGLTVLGWRILAILGSQAPLPAKTIAEMVATDQVTISRAIDQLSIKKLIRRRVDPSDRRRQLIRLSDRGVEAYRQIIPLFIAAEDALLSPLSASEAAELRRLLTIVTKRAEARLSENTPWQEVLTEFGSPAKNGD